MRGVVRRLRRRRVTRIADGIASIQPGTGAECPMDRGERTRRERRGERRSTRSGANPSRGSLAKGQDHHRHERDISDGWATSTFVTQRLGLVDSDLNTVTATFPSPFHYPSQALLALPTDIQAPNVDAIAHFASVIDINRRRCRLASGWRTVRGSSRSHRDVRAAAYRLYEGADSTVASQSSYMERRDATYYWNNSGWPTMQFSWGQPRIGKESMSWERRSVA